jgi:tungstate transport system substrate-binding protein
MTSHASEKRCIPFPALSLLLVLIVGLALVLGGVAAAKAPVLRMATTTSTDNTGLLDYLAPLFQKATGIELQWVAVGTGKAIEFGKNGDVDILFVHDPESEKAFLDGGFGANRRQVMYNDFIFVGPKEDPARYRDFPPWRPSRPSRRKVRSSRAAPTNRVRT